MEGWPAHSYLVCATERSGSTLLCELLAGTGVAGRPEEYFEFLSATGRVRQPREYFPDDADPEILELLAPLEPPLPAVPWEQRLARGARARHHPQRRLRLEDDVGLPAGLPRPRRARGAARPAAAGCTSSAATRSRRRSRCGARCRPRSGAPRTATPATPTSSPSSTRARSRTSSAARRSTPPPGACGSPSAASSRWRSSTRSSRRTRARRSAGCSSTSACRATGVDVPEPPMRRQSDAPLAGVGRPLPRGGPRMTATDTVPHLSQLRALEAEAVHIMREVAAQLERPVLLFSGGKDSIVLLRLAEKAFRPGAFPFPVMHVDTGHNFPEVIEFRDRRIARARRAADRRLRAGLDRHRPRAGGDRPGRLAQPAADDHAARRDRRPQLRRRVRRRAPRRGARPRQGADLLLPRRARPVGPARPAAGDLEPLQRRRRARRARARVPALELDRARRLALHRRGAARDPEHLLRARARGVRARRHAAGRLRVAASRATARRSRRSPCATAPSAT